MTEPKDYNIDDAKSNTPKIDELLRSTDKMIETRVMREPLGQEEWLIAMRLRLTDAFTEELKDQLYQLILEVINTNDDGLNPELYEIRNSLRELQRQKLSDLFNIKETNNERN